MCFGLSAHLYLLCALVSWTCNEQVQSCLLVADRTYRLLFEKLLDGTLNELISQFGNPFKKYFKI